MPPEDQTIPTLPGHPTAIHFGPGVVEGLVAALPGQAPVLVVASAGMRRRAPALFAAVARQSAAVFVDDLPRQTTLEALTGLIDAHRGRAGGSVLAVGGGTTMDAAKALAIGIPAGTSFPEILRAPGAVADRRLPLVCVPTTAGSGSDVTAWATVWDLAAVRKRSLSHPALHPDASWIDPRLAVTLPASVTAASGLDALAHAMEAIWNRRHTPETDGLAARAVRLVFDHLATAASRPGDLEARTAMATAALAAGLAMSRTRTAVAHAVSYPLTLRHRIPHGPACALGLPWLLRQLAETHPDRVAVLTAALAAPDAESIARAVETLLERLGLPTRLREYGVAEADLRPLAEAAFASDRMDNTLDSWSPGRLHDMLRAMR